MIGWVLSGCSSLGLWLRGLGVTVLASSILIVIGLHMVVYAQISLQSGFWLGLWVRVVEGFRCSLR